jgi:hypothetical protein
MLNAISVEKYAFIVEQTRALEVKKKELAEKFRQELQPGGEAATGYIHEVKLSKVPVVGPRLDYRAALVDAIGAEKVEKLEARTAKQAEMYPDLGTPRLLLGNVAPADPDLLRRVGSLYVQFRTELFK